MLISKQLRQTVTNFKRSELEDLLDMIGIQCYDAESDETLMFAVLSNLEDGTLTKDDILSVSSL